MGGPFDSRSVSSSEDVHLNRMLVNLSDSEESPYYARELQGPFAALRVTCRAAQDDRAHGCVSLLMANR